MSELRNNLTRYFSFLAVPLWAGVLAFPFTGPWRALQVALVMLAGFVLWRLLKTDSVSRIANAVIYKISGIRANANELLSRTRSPLFLFLVVVLLFVIPFFQNDYYRDVLTLTGMYAVLALGLNLMVGQTGLLNLG